MRLQKNIGYKFKNHKYLKLALTHRSYSKNNNERLEYLGDSILSFVIADDLCKKFLAAQEGKLSRMRAHLVKGETLASIASEFHLEEFIQLGSGELKSGGYLRKSIHADVLEALIGAVYMDAGIDICRQKIIEWFKSRLDAISIEEGQKKDSKTKLQEYLQSRSIPLPIYEIIETSGMAHQQSFIVSCSIDSLSKRFEGSGYSRRSAEQEAAKQALIFLKVN